MARQGEIFSHDLIERWKFVRAFSSMHKYGERLIILQLNILYKNINVYYDVITYVVRYLSAI